MTIRILLEPEEEQGLRERARQSGRGVEEYLHELSRMDLSGVQAGETSVKRSQTFDQILAPIREGFARSGMTEDEIMSDFEEARQEVHQERRARRGTS
jgi:hypothetical protein